MKKRIDLPKSVDPSTFKYIQQLTGQQSAFEDSEPDSADITEKQALFIRHYTSSGGITKTALRQSNSTRKELAEWMTQEPFKAAFKIAQDDWVEELRKAAMLRATAKSDVLLIFLLKALKPDVFDEDVRKQQYVGLNSNKDAIPVRATLVRDNTINVTFDSAGLTTESAEQLRDILISDSSDDSSS